MDNVTLGGICIAVSLGSFLLVNVLSIQSWLQKDEEEPLEGQPASPAPSSPQATARKPA